MPNLIEIPILICLFLIHWIGDYVLQTREQGDGKSSSNSLLLEHTVTYSVFLGLGVFLMVVVFNMSISIESIMMYATTNFLLHTITDWFTSRATKTLWAVGEEWATFAVMGFDQFIHMTCLVASYGILK